MVDARIASASLETAVPVVDRHAAAGYSGREIFTAAHLKGDGEGQIAN
jgi:hypothetical protein